MITKRHKQAQRLCSIAHKSDRRRILISLKCMKFPTLSVFFESIQKSTQHLLMPWDGAKTVGRRVTKQA